MFFGPWADVSLAEPCGTYLGSLGLFLVPVSHGPLEGGMDEADRSLLMPHKDLSSSECVISL